MHYKSNGRRTKRSLITVIAFLVMVCIITAALCCCGIAKEPVKAEPVLATVPITVVSCGTTYEEDDVSQIEESPHIYDNIPFEEDMQELLWDACEETGCPYELALSVIWHESRFQNVNGDGGNSIGYMQVQPRWHQERMERLGVTDLSDPSSNFRVGCDLLSELIEKYGSTEDALTCYNTGSPGTSKYATRVMKYMDETFLGQVDTQ